jgi:hypothetical protein
MAAAGACQTVALPPAGRCYQRHDIKEYIQIKPPRDLGRNAFRVSHAERPASGFTSNFW